MFRHCVLFRFTPDVTPDQIAEMAAGLDRLTGIETVRAFRHGSDLGLSEGNWDYGVVGDFDDVDGYLVYARDENHQRLIADTIVPLIADRAAIQFETA